MSVLVSYAVRSGLLVEESCAAIDVAGEVSVKRIQAQGLALEVKALSWALRRARELGFDSVRVAVPARFNDVLVGTVPVPEVEERIVQNVRKMLLHNPCEVVVSDSDPALEALVAAQPLYDNGWSLSEEDARWVADNGATVVYTDGSCSGDMVGGWGWYVDGSSYASGAVETIGTALTAERRAVAEALKANPGPVLVLSDHESVMESFDAFLAAMRIPDPLDALVRSAPVRVSHVKGHADCPGNRRADRLASLAKDARLEVLRFDPDLAILHSATVAEVTARLFDRQEARRKQERWCSVRRRELLAETCPDFDGLDQPDRKRIGHAAHLQAMREYSQLSQLV